MTRAISFRSISEADQAFLYRVYASTREEELANVIRNLDECNTGLTKEEGNDELARVLKNLRSLSKGGNSRRITDRTEQDADYLEKAIKRLKKVQLTKSEAEACATVVQNLRKIGPNDFGEETVNEDIRSLRKIIESAAKLEKIESVLIGLRGLELNDEEQGLLYDIVVSLGKRSDCHDDEISDVLGKLRKVNLNKREAKEVAGIVIKLRKTNYGKHPNEDEPREVVKLRKVLRDKQVEDVEGTIRKLKEVEMSEKETSELSSKIFEMGSDNPDDQKVSTKVLSNNQIAATPETTMSKNRSTQSGNDAENEQASADEDPDKDEVITADEESEYEESSVTTSDNESFEEDSDHGSRSEKDSGKQVAKEASELTPSGFSKKEMKRAMVCMNAYSVRFPILIF